MSDQEILPLRPKQVGVLSKLIKNPKWLDLSDPGTGKTPPACVYMYWLWSELKIKTLFQMPKSLMAKNKEEFLKFTGFKENQIQIIDGTPKQREKQMENPEATVFIMGFKRFSDDWQTIKDLHPEVGAVVIDEVHMGYKSHTSQRAQSLQQCMRVLGKNARFLAMSGTLIDGRLDSCYTVINIIEPRYYANHFSFMAQHAIKDDMGKVVGWFNHAKLGRIFMRHGHRLTFEEVHGNQDPIIQTEWVEMCPKQEKAYKEFEETAILELDEFIDSLNGSTVEGFNPGVATIRCRQIMACPHLFNILKDNQNTAMDDSLMVHLEDHERRKEPLIIFSAIVPEQERVAKLCESLGFRVGLINGNTSTKVRNKIDVDFRNGDIDIVVCSPETTAVGYNWGHIDHVIFTSIDYKNVNFVQAYRRAIRGARKKTLRVTVLAYKTGVQHRIFQIVNAKSRDLNRVDKSYEILQLGK